MMAIRPPQFGQKEYWDEQYKQEKSFSWYTGWADLRPFWEEVIAPPTTAPRTASQRHTSVTPASHQRHTSVTPRVPPVQVCPNRTARVLVPGVGNDAAMVSMFDDGWKRLTLFDYSPEGVRRAAELFGERPVDLRVADACALPYASAAFDAVLDKVRLKAFVCVRVRRRRHRHRHRRHRRRSSSHSRRLTDRCYCGVEQGTVVALPLPFTPTRARWRRSTSTAAPSPRHARRSSRRPWRSSRARCAPVARC